jgi:hypothetical protein
MPRVPGALRAVAALPILAVVVLGAFSAEAAGAGARPTQLRPAPMAGRSRPARGARSRVTLRWIAGDRVPGTPLRYDRVGILRVGRPGARNVLVLEPGTSAAAAYFLPLARWIVARRPGWQVWAVDRRETLLEDQSELNLAKQGRISSTQLFDYYLGWLANPRVRRHYEILPNSSVEFAKRWGMAVAVQDLRRVIDAARRLGGEVVLGGHSLGGSVVTAYATWDFGGRPGADGLSGLVYIDGGSGPAEPAPAARRALAALDPRSASPWLAFGGIAAPFAGLFVTVGAQSALSAPDRASLAQDFPLLPSALKPPVPASNLAQFGYALNTRTSPPSLAAAQAHLGAGLDTATRPAGWNSTGALTPIRRFAEMFAGTGLSGANGSEWYFPLRLAEDTAGVDNGLPAPAQRVLGLRSTMGRRLPRSLRILAFCTSLGGARVLAAARALARQSGIPSRHLTLIDRASSYAHNDPAGAYPHNAFVAALLPFLSGIAARR